jgi:hypothetical protein
LPEEFAALRRLMEGRLVKHGRREYVQVLRLLESFDVADLHAAVKHAIRLGAIGFDAFKHLILCRVERRQPRLDLAIYPYLPRAMVKTTSAKAYMRLLSLDAGEADEHRSTGDPSRALSQGPEAADFPARVSETGPAMHHGKH